jgi:hypothetical protein
MHDTMNLPHGVTEKISILLDLKKGKIDPMGYSDERLERLYEIQEKKENIAHLYAILGEANNLALCDVTDVDKCLLMEDAVASGNIECIQAARKHGAPWDKFVCAQAAYHGYLHVLQWAQMNDAPLDWNVYAWAAVGGHLHILEWAHENKVPWNEKVYEYAARGGHQRILQWVSEY